MRSAIQVLGQTDLFEATGWGTKQQFVWEDGGECVYAYERRGSKVERIHGEVFCVLEFAMVGFQVCSSMAS